ncbi:hypothetical protein [Krasilnikovia sp. M28-CT-15]|uniref:hypothetical protein n=1 Tax=Krasilnikovia sp. M28-CT-15 TaxID=3373540 RepID=UPI00387659CC
MNAMFLFNVVVGHVPLLAVLVFGFARLAAHRARLGHRTTTLARAGLGVLALVMALEMVWSALFPVLLGQSYLTPTQYGVASFGVGMVLSVAGATGIGLLVAAVIARSGQGGAEAAGDGLGRPVAEPPPDPYTRVS